MAQIAEKICSRPDNFNIHPQLGSKRMWPRSRSASNSARVGYAEVPEALKKPVQIDLAAHRRVRLAYTNIWLETRTKAAQYGGDL